MPHFTGLFKASLTYPFILYKTMQLMTLFNTIFDSMTSEKAFPIQIQMQIYIYDNGKQYCRCAHAHYMLFTFFALFVLVET